MIGVLLWACTAPSLAPGGAAVGESWHHEPLGLRTDFPPAWRVTADPAVFSSGLGGVLAEADSPDEGLHIAVVFTPLPVGLELLSALDLLVALAPSPDVLDDSTYRLERVPSCRDGIYRRRTGTDGRTVHQVARRAEKGLVIWHGWQAGDRRGAGVRLRQIACERSEVRGR